MPNVQPTSHARDLLREQIDRIGRLRGSGPNPIDYDQWDARTRELLGAAFGPDSEQYRRYDEAVGTRGRLPGVRGQAENMTLNIHGQWGILGRLERAQALLEEFVAAP